jgi:hypothetical protein
LDSTRDLRQQAVVTNTALQTQVLSSKDFEHSTDLEISRGKHCLREVKIPVEFVIFDDKVVAPSNLPRCSDNTPTFGFSAGQN